MSIHPRRFYDATFRNPPVPTADTRVAGAAVVYHGTLAALAFAAFF
ncbi:hypothetical protein [Natronorubrum sediminis]|nr:hypothetical protein [Natronorubrum sediminis]